MPLELPRPAQLTHQLPPPALPIKLPKPLLMAMLQRPLAILTEFMALVKVSQHLDRWLKHTCHHNRLTHPFRLPAQLLQRQLLDQAPPALPQFQRVLPA
jgi:hypothetical protein